MKKMKKCSIAIVCFCIQLVDLIYNALNVQVTSCSLSIFISQDEDGSTITDE